MERQVWEKHVVLGAHSDNEATVDFGARHRDRVVVGS